MYFFFKTIKIYKVIINIKYISTSPGIIDDLFASFNSFLNSTYSLFGFIESIDIQRFVSKKKIETNLICLVCPELR